MQKEIAKIDLKDLTQGRVRMLSGHQRGSAARDHFGIEELERNNENIIITVPLDLDAISPSFVQGLFSKSSTLLKGKDGFLAKYVIEADEDIKKDILVGIDRLLMKRDLSV